MTEATPEALIARVLAAQRHIRDAEVDRTTGMAERAEAIAEAVANGVTYTEIGHHLRVSGTRVKAMIDAGRQHAERENEKVGDA